MRALLSEAIKRIEKLPPDLQDEIAEQILDDIKNERNWQETLSKPQKKIEKLAEEALENSKAGKTKKLGFDKL
jgi:aspartate/tyrosine/aromatic aminotransferase